MDRRDRSMSATARLNELGNMLLLGRPLHVDAMLGAVRSAVKAQRRQYQVRDAAMNLERAVEERTAEPENARASLEVAVNAADMGSWDIDLATGGDVPSDVPRLAKPFRQADLAGEIHALLTCCKGPARLRSVQ